MRSGLAVVALVLWLAPAVSGADVFRYETEEGTIAFTDDVKRVPARYRDQAERLPELSLWDHPRVTIVESRRDETVRAQPAVEAPAAEAPSSPNMAFEVSPGLWMDLEVDADNPIEVEREWRWVDGVLRPHTVVRQGGKILAVRVQN
jgi:hypothetical protein